MSGKNRLCDLQVHEVSLVDYPANKAARVMLFKRDGAAALRKLVKNVPAGLPEPAVTVFKGAVVAAIAAGANTESAGDLALKAVELSWARTEKGWAAKPGAEILKAWADHAVAVAKYGEGEAVDFARAQQNVENYEQTDGLMREVNEAVCSLSSSIYSIVGDAEVSDKAAMVAQSLDQFAEHVKTIVPEGVENALIAQAIAEAGFRINPLGGLEVGKGADSMSSAAIKKSLGLTDNATDAEVSTALTAALEKHSVTAKRVDALLKMNADDRAYYAQIDKAEDVAKFIDADDAGRATIIKAFPPKKKPAADATDDDAMEKAGELLKTHDGRRILKSEVGEGVFGYIKSTESEMAKTREQLAKAADKDALNDIAKRVSVLKNIGGTDEIATLLRDIGKHDPKLSTAVEETLKRLDGVIEKGGLLTEVGKNSHVVGKAGDAIQKHAEELRKANPKWSIEKARDQARIAHPELAKAENAERSDQKKAA